ncbi:DUF2617 family protein [Actinocorallia populi]|uniref:DUF2617 family protein n=1 Tax=Actinocorallia populi TaxID=2079200 RepID=UPI000D08B3AA|nr:DUF2617 family protein [Actinocorallia populi]
MVRVLSALEVPYRDTSADALVFALDEPRLEALAVRRFHTAGLTVELRLLGASHQVLAGPVIETVACLPGRAGGLPDEVTRPLDGWTYTFESRTRRAADFPAELARVERALDRPEALSGVFPGAPGALTGIVLDARPDGLGWRTWHTYPPTGELVETTTRMVRP